MYFPDLSTYSYEMSNEIPKALNIGWLSEEHPFLTGDVPSGIKAKIRHLCLRYRSPLQHRGYHWCEFCPRQETELRGMKYPTPLEDGVKLGSALVVVPIPKNEEVFVCPESLSL